MQKRLVSVLPNDDFIYLGSVSLFSTTMYLVCSVSDATANQCMQADTQQNTWHIWYDRAHSLQPNKVHTNIFARDSNMCVKNRNREK